MSNEVACVEPRQSLAAAAAVMSARKIRHLPVVQDGTLVGLLSHRDLPAARSELELGGEEAMSELELREPVARAMTRRVFAVAPDTPALEVAGKLVQRHIGCAPVVDRDGHVLGIVTETDFLDLVIQALHEYPPVAVNAFMARDPVTTRADRPLAEAEAEMIRRRVRHMPVVDDHERLIGLVTHRDVLRWRSSVLETREAFQPDLLVRDAMSRSVVCMTPSTTAETAARMMLGHGFGCVPVVDGDRLVGIVTATDFLDQLAGAQGTNQTSQPAPILRVRDYMSSSVETVAPSDPLEVGAEPLSREETSCLVVMDHDDIAGLVTRTDLVEEAGPSAATLLPRDPAEKVASRMTRGVVQVEADAPLIDACRAMIEREVHQLVVVEDGAPIGILSRWDVIAAARDLRLDSPLGAFATQVAFTLGCEESLGTARAFLEAADVSNILIMDGRFPVGAFGKREAIQARDEAPESAVGGAMSRAILVLPADTPLHHAAAQMIATGAHLITILRDGPEGGVLTATDFTEVLARLAA